MASVKEPIFSNGHLNPSPSINGVPNFYRGNAVETRTDTNYHIDNNPIPPVQPQASPKPHFELEEHPIDEFRDIKVGVLGAGLAGITAGVLLPAKLPGLDLRIYDKNPDVGGTWFENTYPGVRCDIPAHAYQSGFSPNTQWTEEFAQGAEIRAYWQNIANKYDVYRYLRLRQKIEKVEWIPEEAKWKLTIRDLTDQNNKVYEERLDFVISSVGHFNAWRLPDYDGIGTYQGTLFHSSNWNHDFDAKGKRVALIGNGASGLQVLPSIQPLVAHVDHYTRNRTWVVESFASTGVRRLEPNYFTAEQLESFKDPEKYLEYRKQVESGYFQRFSVVFKNAPENLSLRDNWTKLMLSRIADKPELGDKIIPDFPPNCRRPTPGPGYLEALTKENVEYIQTPIQRITEKGIVTIDGTEREVDAIICATGANVDFAPPFPVVANGIDLSSAWKQNGSLGYPQMYLGMAAPDFPNLLWVGGPYATGYSGTVPNSFENQVVYISKALRKFRTQGIRTMAPSRAATDDFIRYCDKFFPRTVWTGNDDSSAGSKNCRSWYNGGISGGKVHAVFPGSASHANYIRREPRWEDFEYTYTNQSGNRFAYFGNGWTSKELKEGSDLTPHLKLPEEIDLRTYHEGWWDV